MRHASVWSAERVKDIVGREMVYPAMFSNNVKRYEADILLDKISK